MYFMFQFTPVITLTFDLSKSDLFRNSIIETFRNILLLTIASKIVRDSSNLFVVRSSSST